jgi:hypothetical protein
LPAALIESGFNRFRQFLFPVVLVPLHGQPPAVALHFLCMHASVFILIVLPACLCLQTCIHLQQTPVSHLASTAALCAALHTIFISHLLIPHAISGAVFQLHLSSGVCPHLCAYHQFLLPPTIYPSAVHFSAAAHYVPQQHVQRYLLAHGELSLAGLKPWAAAAVRSHSGACLLPNHVEPSSHFCTHALCFDCMQTDLLDRAYDRLLSAIKCSLNALSSGVRSACHPQHFGTAGAKPQHVQLCGIAWFSVCVQYCHCACCFVLLSTGDGMHSYCFASSFEQVTSISAANVCLLQ